MSRVPPVRRPDHRSPPLPMIRLYQPEDLGITLTDLRVQVGFSRRALATHVAEHLGLPMNTIESQLQRYEKGMVASPDLRALAPILEALGYDLAFTPREDT